jgi:phosphohistidine phosphatase
MRLVLVRHAEAAPGEPDDERRLTPEGRRQARALGERLVREGLRPDALLTSPLRRAWETGMVLGDALGVRSEASPGLGPGATVETVRKAIEGRGETVVAVGHQPDCGEIAVALGADPEPRFPPAGAHEIRL